MSTHGEGVGADDEDEVDLQAGDDEEDEGAVKRVEEEDEDDAQDDAHPHQEGRAPHPHVDQRRPLLREART